MPLVRIEILKGKGADYKKAIMDGVHRSLVDAVKIPEHDRTQRLYELDPVNFEMSGNKTENFTLIEITMFKGRSVEAKRKLYSYITGNLEKSPGIAPEDIIIVIHEPELYNWGVRGKPAGETDLGFNINV